MICRDSCVTHLCLCLVLQRINPSEVSKPPATEEISVNQILGMLLLLFGALMSRHIGAEMKLLLSSRVWLHHKSCQEKHCWFLSMTGFVLDAWSPVPVHTLTSVSMSAEVRKQQNSFLLISPLSLLFSSSLGTLLLITGCTLWLSAWMCSVRWSKSSSVSSPPLPPALWVSEWVSVWKKTCVYVSFGYKHTSQSSLLLCSLSLSGTCFGFCAPSTRLLEGKPTCVYIYTVSTCTHEYINLKWCLSDMTHPTFLSYALLITEIFTHCYRR